MVLNSFVSSQLWCGGRWQSSVVGRRGLDSPVDSHQNTCMQETKSQIPRANCRRRRSSHCLIKNILSPVCTPHTVHTLTMYTTLYIYLPYLPLQCTLSFSKCPTSQDSYPQPLHFKTGARSTCHSITCKVVAIMAI